MDGVQIFYWYIFVFQIFPFTFASLRNIQPVVACKSITTKSAFSPFFRKSLNESIHPVLFILCMSDKPLKKVTFTKLGKWLQSALCHGDQLHHNQFIKPCRQKPILQFSLFQQLSAEGHFRMYQTLFQDRTVCTSHCKTASKLLSERSHHNVIQKLLKNRLFLGEHALIVAHAILGTRWKSDNEIIIKKWLVWIHMTWLAE